VLTYLATLPAFLGYFVCAIALTVLFTLIYSRVTPYDEMRMIREGNCAAAVSLGGAILGFVIPLASVIAHSFNLVDMAVWGIVALVVQIVAHLASRLTVPSYREDMAAARMAVASWKATISVAVGILNAACMVF
jgi:putative membrane protein